MASLKAAINDDLINEEKSTTYVRVAVVLSCYNDEEKLVLVGLPRRDAGVPIGAPIR